MRRIVLIMLLWVGGLAVAVAAYQQQPRSKGSAIEKVKDNLYYIRGGDPNDAATFAGSNVIVFVTDAGVVLVDSMYPGHGREILDKVRSVTPKPVTMLINTHAHGDHTGSNTEFPATIDVLAHENAKAALSRPCDPTRPPCFIGDNAKFLPRKTFKDRMSLLSGKDQIDLYYFGRGHTNGDAWIVFPALGTMATGDMFSRKLHPPPISTEYGGSAVEFAETLEKAVRGITNVDTLIPGHIAVQPWNELTEYAKLTRGFVRMVEDGKKAGRHVDELASTYSLPDEYKRKGYVLAPERVSDLIQLIYRELEK